MKTAAPALRAAPWLTLATFTFAACGGGDGGPSGPQGPSVASSMSAASATTLNGTVGEPVPERPSVVVRDQRGTALAGVTVTFTVSAGGGSISGATVTTDANGVATVGSWTLGTTAGTSNNTITATSASLSSVAFTASAAAGPAANVEKIAGTDNQIVLVGTAVPNPPAVRVTDQHGNPVGNVGVTFAVTAGGGEITGATATTTAQGVAIAGSWTMGSEPGGNTATATVAGIATPVVFTATGIAPSSVVVDGVSPDTLTLGASATITGSGFSDVPGQNTVTVAGTGVTVTAATATQLTVTLPSNMPCQPTGPAEVRVTVASDFGAVSHPLRVATRRTVPLGQLLVLGAGADSRCNELAVEGARYLMAVNNTGTTCGGSTICTPLAFELRGAADAGSATAPKMISPAGPTLNTTTAPPGLISAPKPTAAHSRILEENIRFLNQNRSRLKRRAAGAAFNVVASNPVVGDEMQVRIPKVQAGGFCSNFEPITARVAYVGVRSLILEDKNNQLAGQMDSTWQQIGQEFDATMWGILNQNYGNPLVWDEVSGNVGRVVMVFSRYINDNVAGVAGFVVSCDLFPREDPGLPPVPSSNYGPYFYAYTPTVAGAITDNTLNPPRWRWASRNVIIHEVKHITSFAARAFNSAPSFEEAWLEESTARLSEELYERQRYGFTQRGNMGYGSASLPLGPWCGVRLSCVLANDQPRGFVRAFEDLYHTWYREPHRRSPLGRLNSGDFSFYATGWSLIRWAIDHSSTSESAFLTALNQSTQQGLTNLEARTGRTFAEMQPEWLMAMALDERPGVAVANPRVDFPAWNIRDVFNGLFCDFGAAPIDGVCQPSANFPSAFPFAFTAASFGNFTVSSSVLQGTGQFIELSGSQGAPQMLELTSPGGGIAPDQLRLAIIRLQ